MVEKIVELSYGIVERRIYDEDGKLVEIRKEYPPDTENVRLQNFKRKSGVGGGHEF